jgi:lipoate-protein ligase A
MLVPYCAKPAWCALRPTPDCIDCGHCEVGDAYRLARERGLEVTTITNFEHLSETLTDMRARGVTAYVGMCCSDFFLKRHAAFRDAGMDAVLMDIVGATCYELKEEHLAYAGAFKAEAQIDLDALEKVMDLVPSCAASCGEAPVCGAGGCATPATSPETGEN